MSTPRYPSSQEVRRSMGRIRVAWTEVETLMKAQIAQSLFHKPVEERHAVMVAIHAALGSLTNAIALYLVLVGLEADEDVPPIIEERIEHA